MIVEVGRDRGRWGGGRGGRGGSLGESTGVIVLSGGGSDDGGVVTGVYCIASDGGDGDGTCIVCNGDESVVLWVS